LLQFKNNNLHKIVNKFNHKNNNIHKIKINNIYRINSKNYSSRIINTSRINNRIKNNLHINNNINIY
jgi:hypothetical protein